MMHILYDNEDQGDPTCMILGNMDDTRAQGRKNKTMTIKHFLAVQILIQECLKKPISTTDFGGSQTTILLLFLLCVLGCIR